MSVVEVDGISGPAFQRVADVLARNCNGEAVSTSGASTHPTRSGRTCAGRTIRASKTAGTEEGAQPPAATEQEVSPCTN